MKARRDPNGAAATAWRPAAGPRSLGTAGMTRAEREQMDRDVHALARAGVYSRRPRLVSDCPTGPCPWVSCRHHLKIDVDPITHSVKDNFPGLDVTDMAETCSLRVAALVTPGQTMPLERVGAFVNLTMERARQLEKDGLAVVRRRLNLRVHRLSDPNRDQTRTKGPTK